MRSVDFSKQNNEAKKDSNAECAAAWLRSRSAVLSAPHAESGGTAGEGRLASAVGALAERPLRAAYVGAAAVAGLGRRGRPPSDQVERPRGAVVCGVEQAPC